MTVFTTPYTRDHVRNIQRALNEICYDLPGFKSLNVDGIFGNLSIAMLKRAQEKLNCPPTGIYEDPIKSHIEDLIEKRYLSDQDIRELADQYNIEYAVLKAIIDVESRGFGFLTNSRATILFERHIFYRQIRDRFGKERADELMRLHPDIVNTKTGGYLGKEREWTRLEKAMKLSEVNGEYTDLALRSASWGLGQVMGFHAEKLGYQNVYEMFASAMRDERGQVEMILRYCMSEPGIVKAMKTHDWHTLARLYNGPAYAKATPAYNVRLENAYNKYA